MVILFPSNPISPKAVDGSFGPEAHAAKEAGFKIGRIDLEVILGGEVKIQGVPDDEAVEYRGWLMKPAQYEAMNKALGGRLMTTPEQYVTAYELPRWYRALASTGKPVESLTPESIWLSPEFDLTRLDEIAMLVATVFGVGEDIKKRQREFAEWQAENGPWGHPPNDLLELPGTHAVLVKDYVKSAKHRWFDACYIHHADDAVEIKRVVKNFLNTVSDGLVGSLVFRKFERFKRIGVHSKSQLPLVNEHRAFMSYGKVFYLAPYWAEGDYSGARPEPTLIEGLADGLAALPLVAVDVAERDDGRWMIVEINPGGAAGVPEGGNVRDFYAALWEMF